MKTPTIYDAIDHGDHEERVANQEAFLAAREKQKLIKERFRSWVFSDPERTECLVRIYNDTYNNLRPRLFDGSHLDFPGMNQALKLRSNQNDAVWRGMSSGNTLLAHVVGAGKTFTMAAAGMKMKQAGLVEKPTYVVPKHLLEQFSREFMQLYPNAKLLVAAEEDWRCAKLALTFLRGSARPSVTRADSVIGANRSKCVFDSGIRYRGRCVTFNPAVAKSCPSP